MGQQICIKSLRLFWVVSSLISKARSYNVRCGNEKEERKTQETQKIDSAQQKIREEWGIENDQKRRLAKRTEN
ncbi:hypothetical protein KFK09_001930 [Dendrobium nobile]|uniref:Uncharacterized protein n=1 Tax=Dendrobium nobile TaxID=94219 RepID=A0A8T3CBM3_DENNO|nr:hypothetical protein KFK09_001930 [Dendrobium nobile]